MQDRILVGSGREISSISRDKWESLLKEVPKRMAVRLSFMTPEHRRVRYFVVREIARLCRPISPTEIARRLKISQTRVAHILDKLETRLFFLVRNADGNVSWAFPVTADRTRHRLVFGTGERVYAAWAEDAIAAPFVEGRLMKKRVEVEINTACAHCDRSLRIDLASDLRYRVRSRGAKPLVFEPDVDWQTFREPNIIGSYWRNSLFFWSEEHAKEFRQTQQQPDGAYLTLDQAAYSTRIAQGALFGF